MNPLVHTEVMGLSVTRHGSTIGLEDVSFKHPNTDALGVGLNTQKLRDGSHVEALENGLIAEAPRKNIPSGARKMRPRKRQAAERPKCDFAI
jgi:hypothetical protein